MKRLLTVFALTLFCLCASAQQFKYDAKFDYIFLNREFDRSHNVFEQSGTLHAARLTPLVGLDWNQGGLARHSLRLGVDIFKNMGEGLGAGDVFGEVLLYYQAEVPVRRYRGTFSAVAGIFPRRFSEGYYSDAFFSDELYYLDNNFEGMFFKYRTPHFYADLGLDWCGMKGLTRREAFRIMSAGSVDLFGTGLFGFGWSASMFHYAGSQMVRGVVDNTLVNPYLKVDFSSVTPVQKLSLMAGPLVGYQWDRVAEPEARLPWGLESVFTLQNWNVGLENIYYHGDDLYLLYDRYGESVYYGEPFYNWPWEGRSWFNKLSVYWQPRIAPCISLRVAVELFFGEANDACPVAYRGTSQKLTLLLDLEKLRVR